MARVYKIYGPPGTGKTFRLIKRAQAYRRCGVPYHKIGYFAFTRKAAGEARSRIGVSEKDVPYFQTLHAFGFHLLGLKEENIMQPYHYADLGKKLGIRVNFSDAYNKEETHFLTCNNPYFQLIGRAINRNTSVRVEFDRNEHDHKDIEWTTLRNIEVNLKEYKEKNKLRDFNDIITDVIKLKDTPQFPTFGAVFIDEAQDLSPLQWKLFDVLKEKTKDMYLAGDDDQAIFAWAGADVNRFINEPAQEKILRYSRRVSKAVLEQSQIIVGRISGIRKQKDYFPRAQEGLVSHISNLGQVDLTKGKWLILSRTKNNLLKIMEELRRKGLYYESNKGKSFKVSIYKAAVAYTSWRFEEKLEAKAIAEIREYTPAGKWDIKKEWYEAFTQASQEDILYIRNLLSNNEKLNEDARIFVSTIHAAKGGEEDNVILSLHQGRKVQKGIALSIDKQDEEHRVWYVGSTRARINLYKLVSKVHRKEYIL